MGCAFVVLDDVVLSSVVLKLVERGKFVADDFKPATLLEMFLTMAKDGHFAGSSHAAGASISKSMRQDLDDGLLEDPYDDRAVQSCQEMEKWEEAWRSSEAEPLGSKPLPIVVFLRTSASTSLLKSKSAIEYLMQEVTSGESIHMLVLGRGIDASTTSLPVEPIAPEPQPMGGDQSAAAAMMGQDGGAPWFGFSPQNQNASGQNDPEGSRRFNIFLARTVDPSGQPGILGAIAPPQAGNLFPHLMAMQAKERIESEEDENSPMKAELERWAQLLSQQMHNNGGAPLPPPQFFNASLAGSPFLLGNPTNPLQPNQQQQQQQPQIQPNIPPEVVQQALQQAMSELLDRLAQLDGEAGDETQKDFSQLLKNENLRRGIAENLSRAAPALTDPKCQGVMLSVYVPPMNRPKHGWFQKILNNDEAEKKKRVRTMAAAAAMVAASKGSDGGVDHGNNGDAKPVKSERNLAKLESVCRRIRVGTPADPVRAKSWDAWFQRERGAVLFRQNRIALQEELAARSLTLKQDTGTLGAGSALRQMLSVREIVDDMEEIVKCVVELEAAKSQRQQVRSWFSNGTEYHEELTFRCAVGGRGQGRPRY